MKLKRFQTLTLMMIAAVTFFAAAPAYATDQTISEHTLKNGMKVLVLEKHDTPVAAVQVWYRVGSHNEWKGVRGIAHITEHMMFRGSEHYGPEQHSRLITEIGGYSNAFTSMDATAYVEKVPSSGLELAVKLEAERMHLLKLNPDIFNTELNVVKEEYRLYYENDPIGEAQMKVQKILYPDHPYNWGPIGVMDDLNKIVIKDCQDFYNRFYAPNNAVLVVAGDVDPKNAVKLAEKYFGPIPLKSVPREPDLSLAPQTESKKFKEKMGLPVPITAIAFRIPESSHKDIVPLKVLNAIISKGKSSRLEKSIIRKKGLGVYVLDFPLFVKGPGYLVYGVAHLPTVSSKKAEQALWEEINKVKSGPISDQELKKAQNQLISEKIFEKYSAYDLAQSIGDAEVVAGDYRLFQSEVGQFEKVSRADLKRVADQYLTKENATVIIMQPKKQNLLVWLYGFISAF